MTQDPRQTLQSTIPLAQLAVAACKAHGIDKVIISPGSRNAPLTLSFSSDPYFDCYSMVDERCAAFFALGIAQQTGQPAILVCTSGSAVLNYYPAIAEAYYSNIPLIVLSADRPAHKIDIGDGQTIKQQNVFGEHVGYAANCIEDCGPGSVNFEYFQKAMQTVTKKMLPVHLNLPFEEPLYNLTESTSINYKPPADAPVKSSLTLSEVELNIWKSAERIMVLVGSMAPQTLGPALLDELLQDPRVLMLTETTSNLHHPKLVTGIDQLIAAMDGEEHTALKPDLLLSFGGMVVSKKIKAFLRAHPPKHHWHADPLKAYDTFFVLSQHFKCDARELLSLLNSHGNDHGNYQAYWLNERDRRRANHNPYLESIPYSDLKVYDAILNNLPANCQLQVANSAAIRYTQLFEIPESITVFCNRGTSGIDGSMSTAIGAAIVDQRQVVFLTGDLSFFYDSNAMWNTYTPASFKVVLVNNSGGGIFRILPGDKTNPNFQTYFETTHNLKADKLCEMYGWHYTAINEFQELEEVLKSDFWKLDGPAVLEIFTPRTVNDQLLLDYFQSVK